MGLVGDGGAGTRGGSFPSEVSPPAQPWQLLRGRRLLSHLFSRELLPPAVCLSVCAACSDHSPLAHPPALQGSSPALQADTQTRRQTHRQTPHTFPCPRTPCQAACPLSAPTPQNPSLSWNTSFFNIFIIFLILFIFFSPVSAQLPARGAAGHPLSPPRSFPVALLGCPLPISPVPPMPPARPTHLHLLTAEFGASPVPLSHP